MINGSRNSDKPDARPMDPTKSGEDFWGDTTGMTGVTTGSAQGTSSTPDDRVKDEDKMHLPGGITKGQGRTDDVGVALDDDAGGSMSDVKAAEGNDLASEDEVDSNSKNTGITPGGDVRLNQSEEASTQQAAFEQPYNRGEQSISGTTPDPESDDDTLENAQSVGQQMSEDSEHPEELDIARDIDKGEEEARK